MASGCRGVTLQRAIRVVLAAPHPCCLYGPVALQDCHHPGDRRQRCIGPGLFPGHLAGIIPRIQQEARPTHTKLDCGKSGVSRPLQIQPQQSPQKLPVVHGLDAIIPTIGHHHSGMDGLSHETQGVRILTIHHRLQFLPKNCEEIRVDLECVDRLETELEVTE